jgi:hypothetical protein
MTAIRHGTGIHCLHSHGWNTEAWCLCCRNHLHNTDGFPPVEEWTRLDFEHYEHERDAVLARTVLAALADGSIPPSSVNDDFDLSSVFEPRATP